MNDPDPEVVQIPPVALVTEPFKPTEVTSLQVVISKPAFIIGTGENIIDKVSAIESHPPIEVKYKSTEPNETSPTENVYVVLSEFEFANAPVPLVDHSPPVELVAVPVKAIEV